MKRQKITMLFSWATNWKVLQTSIITPIDDGSIHQLVFFCVEITRMTSSYNSKRCLDNIGLENKFFERKINCPIFKKIFFQIMQNLWKIDPVHFTKNYSIYFLFFVLNFVFLLILFRLLFAFLLTKLYFSLSDFSELLNRKMNRV